MVPTSVLFCQLALDHKDLLVTAQCGGVDWGGQGGQTPPQLDRYPARLGGAGGRSRSRYGSSPRLTCSTVKLFRGSELDRLLGQRAGLC